MKDLISRQSAIDALDCINGVEEVLRSLPSAQPGIIQCKDCKLSEWYIADDGQSYYYCIETGASGRTAEDYCSFAERRQDG